MRIGYLMQAGAPRLITQPFSGPAVHVREVCQGLRKLGHEVRIIAWWDQQICYSDDCQTFQPAPIAKALTISARGLLHVAPLDSFVFALAARSLLRGCDLLYERMGWLAFGGAMLAAMLRLPFVVEVNGDHLWERSVYGKTLGHLAVTVYKAVTKKALTQANHVIATGPGWRSRILDRFQLKAERVTVVQNGTQLVELLNRSQLCCFSEADDEGPVRIVYLGGFYPWHAIGRLLRVTKRLLERGFRVHLALIGSGPGEHNARDLAAKMGLRGETAFWGSLAPCEYAAALARCEIGVAAYCGTIEFSGLKLMDYKAAGLAILTTGWNGEPGVIQHGVTGIVVEPCRDDQLYEGFVKLILDRDLRRSLGRAARIEAEQKHSWQITVHVIDSILGRICPSEKAVDKGCASLRGS